MRSRISLQCIKTHFQSGSKTLVTFFNTVLVALTRGETHPIMALLEKLEGVSRYSGDGDRD